jgi:hypothetical protein
VYLQEDQLSEEQLREAVLLSRRVQVSVAASRQKLIKRLGELQEQVEAEKAKYQAQLWLGSAAKGTDVHPHKDDIGA